MPHKGKLPATLKIQIVEAYLTGGESPSKIIQKYGICSSTLRQWVSLYKARGPESLTPKSKWKSYTAELKQQVVSEYFNGEGSPNSLCVKYGISDDHVVRKWIKKYIGHEELKTSFNGGVIYMTNSRKTTTDERIEIVKFCIENSKDYVKTVLAYQVSYQQIYSWVRKYIELGEEGLSDHRGKRKNPVAMTEVEKVQAELKRKEAENKRLRIELELLKKVVELERRRY